MYENLEEVQYPTGASPPLVQRDNLPVITTRLDGAKLVYEDYNPSPWLKRLHDCLTCTMGLFHPHNVSAMREWLKTAPPVEWQLSIWNLLVVAHRINVNYALTAGQIRAGSSHALNHPANLAAEQQLPADTADLTGISETGTGGGSVSAPFFKGEASNPAMRIKIPEFLSSGETAGSCSLTQTARR